MPSLPNPPRLTTLWVDGCGGFGVLTGDAISVGRQGSDINVLADLRRRAGTLHRHGEDWGWTDEAGGTQSSTHWLADDQPIPVGGGVHLSFRRPHPLSSTAVLTIRPPHRFDGHLDGYLLARRVIVIGPTPDCHLQVRHADTPVTLKWNRRGWSFRHDGQMHHLDGGNAVQSGWLGIRAETRPDNEHSTPLKTCPDTP